MSYHHSIFNNKVVLDLAIDFWGASQHGAQKSDRNYGSVKIWTQDDWLRSPNLGYWFVSISSWRSLCRCNIDSNLKQCDWYYLEASVSLLVLMAISTAGSMMCLRKSKNLQFWCFYVFRKCLIPSVLFIFDQICECLTWPHSDSPDGRLSIVPCNLGISSRGSFLFFALSLSLSLVLEQKLVVWVCCFFRQL